MAFPNSSEQPNRRPRQSRPGDSERVYTSEDAEDIYKRSAEIHADTLFQDEQDDKLSEVEIEDAAERVGIDERIVNQAMAEREQERREAAEAERRKAAEAQAAAARRAMLVKRAVVVGGLFVALCGVSVWRTQAVLSGARADVEAAYAQVDNVLQRRHELVPQLIRVTKANLEQQKSLAQALSAASQRASQAPRSQEAAAEAELDRTIDKTLEALSAESANSPVVMNLAAEMAGAANRVSVERRKYNLAAGKYNRAIGTFPAALLGPVMGFPHQYEYFQADPAARKAPEF